VSTDELKAETKAGLESHGLKMILAAGVNGFMYPRHSGPLLCQPHLVAALLSVTESTAIDLKGCREGIKILQDHVLEKLSYLRLNGSELTPRDVEYISKLKTLRSLDLTFTSTRDGDLSPLAALTGLESLNLDMVRFGSLDWLAALTNLKSLDLSDYRRDDLPLENLTTLTKLETLNLARSGVRRLGPLAAFPNLKYLNLHDNHLGSHELVHLVSLKNLKVLNLDRNGLTSVSVLSELTSLEHLNLSRNGGFTGLGDLAGLNLKSLELSGLRDGVDQVEVGALPAFPSLEFLDLRFSVFPSDSLKLATLTNLKTLNLEGTHDFVTTLDEISSLKNLKTLNIGQTAVTSLAPLSGLTKLESLSFANTGISNIEPLAGMKRLSYICLRDTRVRDMKTLLSLSSLRLVSGIDKSHLTPAELETLKESVEFTW